MFRKTSHRPAVTLAHPRAGGAVILIVLTLLATLTFLGFFFYEWTDQEQLSARAWGETDDSLIDVNPILDQAFEQLLVGTRDSNPNSALWGGRHSVLSTFIGPIDTTMRPLSDRPGTGTGIEITTGGGGLVAFDYDGDGYPDRSLDPTTDGSGLLPLALNFSKVARTELDHVFTNDIFSQPGPIDPLQNSVYLNYRPDTGITYPDINNLFLAYDTSYGGRRILIPSFYRPQLEVNRRADTLDDYFENAETAPRSLRPHMEHQLEAGTPRFITAAAGAAAQSGSARTIPPIATAVDVDGDGILNELGVLTDSGDVYELDVDNDGDGVRDGIWMDLDLPLIDLADGRQVVPLISFKVIDADALLNVNVHGNIQGTYTTGENPLSANFTGSVSKSNQGLTPAEVNPIWALMADADSTSTTFEPPVDESLAQLAFTKMFGAVMPSSLAAANAELMFLIMGRAPAEGGSSLAGRNGEALILDQNLAGGGQLDFTGPFQAPRGGATSVLNGNPAVPPIPGDDDVDQQTQGHQNAHVALMQRNPAVSLTIPPAVHPLDLIGTGDQPYDTVNGVALSNLYRRDDPTPATAGATRRLEVPPTLGANNPSAFPIYRGRWIDHFQNSGADPTPTPTAPQLPTPYHGVTAWSQAVNSELQTLNMGPTDLVDEDNELTVNPWFPNAADSPFHPNEMARLHLTDSDFSRTGEYSRLNDLAPFAFRDAPAAALIRSRFTTDSWDRLEFSHAFRNFANDDWGDAGGDPDQLAPRRWEFNVWNGPFNGFAIDANDIHFPPQFGGTSGLANVGTNGDPFRIELRRLLWTTVRGSATGTPINNFAELRTRPQHRLNLNELLVGINSNGDPIYRPLTPHPAFTTVPPVSGPSPVPNMFHGQLAFEADPPAAAAPNDYPPFANITDAALTQLQRDLAQEWWARFDRQRMARDIYVMLWTLSGGDDFNDYSSSLGTNPPDEYTPERAREMAQFAVNVVDSLDRDNVITRFEYDPDLTDGWDLPNVAVYGVESQLLTFGEVMWVAQPAGSSQPDLTRTLHREDDTTDPTGDCHQWLYIELRNTSPFTQYVKEETWRLVRVPINQVIAEDESNVQAAVQFDNDGVAPKPINPGANFLISCHDGLVISASGSNLPADFYADFENNPGSELETVIPISTSTVPDYNTPPAGGPVCDLDLTFFDANHEPYRFTTKNYGADSVLIGRQQSDLATGFDLVLQRRRNLNAYGHGERLGANQLWVEVDRVQFQATPMFEPSGDSQAAIVEALQGTAGPPAKDPIRSFERPQPFTAMAEHVGGGAQNHSLHATGHAEHDAKNDLLTGTSFTLWQPHFNRDFTSVIDLLSVPLYGWSAPAAGTFNAFDQGGPTRNLTNGGQMDGTGTAATRFLNPYPTLQTPFETPPPGIRNHTPNRWYRLLEFLTVPDRTEEAVASRLEWQRRTPGKVNLNTLRDPTIFKGVVDDSDQLGIPVGTDGPAMQDLYDSRYWYDQLILRRDGIDPVIADPVDFPVPGGVNSRPFRNLSWVAPNFDTANADIRNESIDSTILRAFLQPPTPPTTTDTAFGLFEARAQGDIANSTVDFHTRNRLLAKIHNRTTNRSHVFIVWTTVGFFEAHRLSDTSVVPAAAIGQVQIGGRAEDLPLRRSFMVADMSRIEEAYSDPDPTDDLPGSFDFRKFIIYRKGIK